MEYEPILKFEILTGPETGKFIEMHLTKFSWTEGGEGTCPKCGSLVAGTGKDWKCTNPECGLELNGPIF